MHVEPSATLVDVTPSPDHRRLSDEARDRLVGRPEHVALANYIANHMARRWSYQRRFDIRDEFRREAYWGLMQAAASWEQGRGLKFTTLAYKHIAGRILDSCRMASPLGFRRGKPGKPRFIPLELPEEQDHAGDGRYWRPNPAFELTSGEPEPGSALAAADEFERLTRGLPSPHREVIRCYFGDPTSPTLVEIGRRIGKCESRVSQIVKEALGILRERFGVATPELSPHQEQTMSTTTTALRLVVSPFGAGWVAKDANHPSVWELGATPDEAVGKVILDHADPVTVEVEVSQAA